jgi:hypothetical protein
MRSPKAALSASSLLLLSLAYACGGASDAEPRELGAPSSEVPSGELPAASGGATSDVQPNGWADAAAPLTPDGGDASAPAPIPGLVSHWTFDQGAFSNETGTVCNPAPSCVVLLDSVDPLNFIKGKLEWGAPFPGAQFPNLHGARGANGATATYASPTALKIHDVQTLSAWLNLSAAALDSEDGAVLLSAVGFLDASIGVRLEYRASGGELRVRMTEYAGPLGVQIKEGLSGKLTPGWRHVAWSYDGASFKLFVDGTKKKELPGTFKSSYQRAVTMSINGTSGTWVDDLRQYNRALGDPEIAALAQGAP